MLDNLSYLERKPSLHSRF